MFASITRATRLFFDPGLYGLVLRSVLFTLLLFLTGLAAVEIILAQLPALGNPIVNQALELLAPVLFLFLLGILGAPVAAFFGTFYLDRVADRIEARDYPPARGLAGGTWPKIKAGLRLAGMILAADILMLPLVIGLPGIGMLLVTIVNGWLLGWEYFEQVATRHLDLAQADALRKSHGWQLWVGGILIAFLSEVPLLDLIAPLFGTALMVHLFHRVAQETS